MLLNGHNLDSVISQVDDAWQHLGAEFIIGANRLLLLRHADVALIDEQRVAAWLETACAPLIGLLGRPHLSGKDMGRGVLHHARGVGRDALALASAPVHDELV